MDGSWRERRKWKDNKTEVRGRKRKGTTDGVQSVV